MIRVFAAILISIANLLLVTVSAFTLSSRELEHLLLRTGFGVPIVETGSSPDGRLVQQLRPLDRNEAVAAIVDRAAGSSQVDFPDWVQQPPLPAPQLKNLSAAQKQAALKAYRQELSSRARALQAWWMQQMISSTTPLQERMVLFWHNHFTSSLQKVRSPTLMARQDLLIRKYALGNFRDFLHAIAKDPAMIIYLDNETNSKGRANENFAREVMELFTLGEGHYSEDDVKAAAKAFTGWRVDRHTGVFRAVGRLHDNSVKTFLGRTGRWNGDDVINILLDQKEVSLFITTKLWESFVSPTPDPKEVARIAAVFRSSGYQIRALMEALLESPAFWSASNDDQIVKSPAELLVGLVRGLDITSVEPAKLAAVSARLGQALFDPLSVKGWPYDTDWISSHTLLLRNQIITVLLRSFAREHRDQVSSQEVAKLRARFLDPAWELM